MESQESDRAEVTNIKSPFGIFGCCLVTLGSIHLDDPEGACRGSLQEKVFFGTMRYPYLQ